MQPLEDIFTNLEESIDEIIESYGYMMFRAVVILNDKSYMAQHALQFSNQDRTTTVLLFNPNEIEDDIDIIIESINSFGVLALYRQENIFKYTFRMAVNLEELESSINNNKPYAFDQPQLSGKVYPELLTMLSLDISATNLRPMPLDMLSGSVDDSIED